MELRSTERQEKSNSLAKKIRIYQRLNTVREELQAQENTRFNRNVSKNGSAK
jgi:hypothetical protein